MTGKQIKSLIGIYAASMNIMGILIPVSILAAVAQAFPDVPMAMVQIDRLHPVNPGHCLQFHLCGPLPQALP